MNIRKHGLDMNIRKHGLDMNTYEYIDDFSKLFAKGIFICLVEPLCCFSLVFEVHPKNFVDSTLSLKRCAHVYFILEDIEIFD